jgi:hypothetical protein
LDTVARGEFVEGELDTFIERRDTQRRETEGERLERELWAESVTRYNARRRAENEAAWCEYHRGQAERRRRILASLVAYHEAEAEKHLPKEAA